MNINYDNNNIVEVKGTLITPLVFSHEVLGESFFESKIEVKRLSKEVDILPITISERLSVNLQVGDMVAFRGQLRSYNKQEGEHNKLVLTIFVRELLGDDALANQIRLVGYICKEPIYRTTPFGREIADVLLAVNRAYNKSDYLPCIAWGRNARFVKDLQVGEKVELYGRVQSREYQKKLETETITKVAYEVSVSSIMISEDVEEIHEKEDKTEFSHIVTSGMAASLKN